MRSSTIPKSRGLGDKFALQRLNLRKTKSSGSPCCSRHPSRNANPLAIDCIERFNPSALDLLDIGLGILALATGVAAAGEMNGMLTAGTVTLPDLLYQVPSRVSVYYCLGRLPIRFPLYNGMIALARDLILERKDINQQSAHIARSWRHPAGAFAMLVIR